MAFVIGRWRAGIALLLLAMAWAGCGGPNDLAPASKVVITSSPEAGAEITVGGYSKGKTPVTLLGYPPGPTLVVMSLEGFKRTAKTIEIPASGNERIVVDLEPLVGYITVESKPHGAQVYLDGTEYLGDTPLAHKAVVVGKHEYELRLPNYKPCKATMEIQQDYQYTFMQELWPMNGEVSILSRPSSARIWVNEDLQPTTTPAKIELPPGDYEIRVQSKGYIMATENFALGPNEKRTIELAMKQGDAPEGMVLVPAGKFVMGVNGVSPDEQPQREVELDAFYIDKTEVTNEEFKKVFPQHVFAKNKEQCPVTGVSFKQAVQYAQALGKRLPTEAEWEKAARGTDAREYPWGPDFSKDLCNSAETGGDAPVRIGQYRLGASPYGCMDMAGNAYEWTSDWYKAYPGNTAVTADYGQIYRVLRGGSYRSDRFQVRCARRHYDVMDATRADYGFRCAKDVGE